MLITLTKIVNAAYAAGTPERKAVQKATGDGIDTSTNAGREQMRVLIQVLRKSDLATSAQQVSGVAVR